MPYRARDAVRTSQKPPEKDSDWRVRWTIKEQFIFSEHIAAPETIDLAKRQIYVLAFFQPIPRPKRPKSM